MKKFISMLFILVTLTACSAQGEITESSMDFFAMDTYMNLSATAENSQELIDKAYEMIVAIENNTSSTLEDSDIYKLNHSDGEIVVVSDTTYEILSLAVDYAEATDGAFDPTICAITDLWQIGTENARVPSEVEISTALETVSYQNIILLDDNKVQLLNGAQIDLGGIGKGYTADKIVALYDEYHAVRGVISLAGNIYVYGEKEDNSLWNVGVTDPNDTSSIALSIQIAQTSIVTTGAYERYFEEDGIIYHHIFNPATGYPTDEDILSVTVISEHSALADVYATALFAMGYDDAITVAEGIEDLDVVMINNKNEVYISDGITATIGESYAH